MIPLSTIDFDVVKARQNGRSAVVETPPPSEHLWLFWREKKHQVFFPATMEQNITRVNLLGRRTKCGHLEVKTFHLASLMLSL